MTEPSGEKPKRRRRRKSGRDGTDPSRALWCSWGRHYTWLQRGIQEHYPHGTICLEHQIEIMGNLEKSVFMPELSEAMRVHAAKRWEAQRAEAVAERPLRAKAPDMEGIVYYIRINGQVKIGWTTNLKQRSRAYPPGSELLAVEPGKPELERERHAKFSQFLVRGREWFTESPELSAHIDALTAEYGVPEVLMHKYRKHRPAGGSNG